MWIERVAVMSLCGAMGMACGGERRQPPPTATADQPEPADEPQPRARLQPIASPEVGPIVGDEIVATSPTAGAYGANYSFGSSRYPTREIYVSRSVTGHATLELAPDGVATACFAMRSRRTRSESKYSSPDGKHHSSENVERSLLGARGTWTRDDAGKAQISLDEYWLKTCAPPSSGQGGATPIRLGCVRIEPNERLPVAALACELETPRFGLVELALDLSDSPEAGPVALQDDTMPRAESAPGTPWLLLGSDPGLAVATKDRRRGRGAIVFSAESVRIVERNFVEQSR